MNRHQPPEAAAGAAATVLRERTGVPSFDVAVVLGSGWAAAADRLGRTVSVVGAGELPGFAASGVPGHTGTVRAVLMPGTGAAPDRYALVIGARTHLYEGRGLRAVVHPIRTAAAAGCRVAVLTNGAGGLRREWEPGTPVLISDHINLTGTSPLEGATFVDLTDLYTARLRALAREADPSLEEGVYAQLPGPHFETPAEIRMLGRVGADLVGMSTALEAIAARACGMDVLGLSLVTNPAAGLSDRPLSHQDVLAVARTAEQRCTELLARLVPLL